MDLHKTKFGEFLHPPAEFRREPRQGGAVHSSPGPLFRLGLDHLPQGILIRDGDGLVHYANRAFLDLVGAETEKILGRPLVLHPQDDGDRPQENRELPFPDTDATWQGEIQTRRSDGARQTLSISTHFLEQEQCFLTVFQDTTRERMLEQKLAQSEKLAALGEMLAGVAHELNNPLTSVVGFSELLLRKRVSKDVRSHLKKITFEAIRTSKIVQNLLSFARPREIHKVPVGVNGVVENVLDLKMRQLKLDNIRVVRRMALDAVLPKIQGDYQQLVEAFLNLINNAHQAMASHGKRGTLTIRTESEGSHVSVRIGDTGPGIPKEVRDSLFQPFMTTKPNGNGLGLHITWSIIRAHGGQITVEPTEKRGTTFLIRLPVAAEAFSFSFRPETAGETATSRKTAEGLRILVLDDEEMILNLYDQLLTQLGHLPILVKTVPEAFSRLENSPFDLIFSDIRMPRLTGDKFFSHLQRRHPHLMDRLVFVTGDVHNPRTKDFIKRNRMPVLYKPFSLNQLEGTIRSVYEKTQ